MSNQLAELKAKVALLELEEEFKQKKADGDLTVEDRLELREARRVYREQHRRPPVAGAQPAVVSGSAGVEEDD